MKTLKSDIRRWERELKDLKAEGATPEQIAKVEALLERLYTRLFETVTI